MKVWVYFLKHKSDTFEDCENWKAMGENETKLTIKKKLKTNNGCEYQNTKFNKVSYEHGIKMERIVSSCTPRQDVILFTICKRFKCLKIKQKRRKKKLSLREITRRELIYTTKKVKRAFSDDQFKLQELQTISVVFLYFYELITSNILQFLEVFDNEVRILGKARHQSLTALKDYYWTPQLQLLVSEFAPNGNLQSKLHEKLPSNPSLSCTPNNNLLQQLRLCCHYKNLENSYIAT
ncbi:LRR kinase family protein, putative [Medicago truncatula]|uniref:LRR kinase family protein, putative n=1 Tax=Medicago truncatula TaxID=3880 RepID=G7KTW8_MEDTR|nr:LRR kinase family protein, putative [Medicago truncatula]